MLLPVIKVTLANGQTYETDNVFVSKDFYTAEPRVCFFVMGRLMEVLPTQVSSMGYAAAEGRSCHRCGIRSDRADDDQRFALVLSLVSDFVKAKREKVSGACVKVVGQKCVAAVRTDRVQYDWDLSDDLAELECELAQRCDGLMDGLVINLNVQKFDEVLAEFVGKNEMYVYDLIQDKWTTQ
jgi:hypothetical protein